MVSSAGGTGQPVQINYQTQQQNRKPEREKKVLKFTDPETKKVRQSCAYTKGEKKYLLDYSKFKQKFSNFKELDFPELLKETKKETKPTPSAEDSVKEKEPENKAEATMAKSEFRKKVTELMKDEQMIAGASMAEPSVTPVWQI